MGMDIKWAALRAESGRAVHRRAWEPQWHLVCDPYDNLHLLGNCGGPMFLEPDDVAADDWEDWDSNWEDGDEDGQ